LFLLFFGFFPPTFFLIARLNLVIEPLPPAIREVVLEADKNGEVHLKGIPTCKSGQLQATDTAAAEKACKSALIGSGEATAQVAFAEQKPIDVNSKILVFNGGEKGGKATMFIHAYFANPISGAIVTTVTITKHKHGRFGTLAVAKIPQITGGSGSITKFNLSIKKNVGGKNESPRKTGGEDAKTERKAGKHKKRNTKRFVVLVSIVIHYILSILNESKNKKSNT